MAALAEQPEVGFLSQRFAKLAYGPYTVIGYSVAGEESVVQVPELGLVFDAGRAPQFALASDLLCVTHGHMDHLAGIAYYLSQRHFQGMKPGTVLVPEELADPVDDLLAAWRRVERQDTPYDLVAMRPGDEYAVRDDYLIRCHRTHHGPPSLSYTAVQVRRKLKDEYHGTPGPELARLRKEEGVEIQYTVEVPLVTYMGDTGPGPVWSEPDVVDAQLLITECTFFDPEHVGRSRAGRHLHAEHFAEILPGLKCEQIVVTHVSRRTGVPRAKRRLAKLVGEEGMRRVRFLMDLKDARRAGDAAAAAGTAED